MRKTKTLAGNAISRSRSKTHCVWHCSRPCTNLSNPLSFVISEVVLWTKTSDFNWRFWFWQHWLGANRNLSVVWGSDEETLSRLVRRRGAKLSVKENIRFSGRHNNQTKNILIGLFVPPYCLEEEDSRTLWVSEPRFTRWTKRTGFGEVEFSQLPTTPRKVISAQFGLLLCKLPPEQQAVNTEFACVLPSKGNLGAINLIFVTSSVIKFNIGRLFLWTSENEKNTIGRAHIYIRRTKICSFSLERQQNLKRIQQPCVLPFGAKEPGCGDKSLQTLLGRWRATSVVYPPPKKARFFKPRSLRPVNFSAHCSRCDLNWWTLFVLHRMQGQGSGAPNPCKIFYTPNCAPHVQVLLLLANYSTVRFLIRVYPPSPQHCMCWTLVAFWLLKIDRTWTCQVVMESLESLVHECPLCGGCFSPEIQALCNWVPQICLHTAVSPCLQGLHSTSEHPALHRLLVRRNLALAAWTRRLDRQRVRPQDARVHLEPDAQPELHHLLQRMRRLHARRHYLILLRQDLRQVSHF